MSENEALGAEIAGTEYDAGRALEDWLIDHRWPNAYDLAAAIIASDWLAERDARERVWNYPPAAGSRIPPAQHHDEETR